ncbi:hypothetical protein [Breoghania sp. L-A4]|uniref:hypothetical protein n=1 Tax=Breoghania sp. L-A4 TaxID=2304600 RepID=UPI000E35ED7F|nr:hypothetical protein [Breoghania sp. L-A4]AXS39916.1 hypothetical protein D1F64_07425 [Breoghania sp. L-A4]
MVVALSASLFSPSASGKSGGSEEASKEVQQLKAEILSARSEKQCATCEGDKKKLDEQIQQLETKMRQVQSGSKVEPERDKDRLRSGDAPGAAPAGGPGAADGARPPGLETNRATALESRGDGSGVTPQRFQPPPGQPGHVLDISV